MSGKKASGRGLSLGLAIAAILLLALAAREFAFDGFVVRGDSMNPGLRDGEVVFYSKLAYGLKGPFSRYILRWAQPEPGDVVVALRPDSGTAVVKRVAGLSREPGPSGEPRIELVGDNYYRSVDSRDFGPVPMNNIVGKVLRFPRFYPRSRSE